MDRHYMQQALELAERARGRTSPNPLVGAVVVKDGRVIGRGWHQKAGTPHAEIHALKDAGEGAAGATLYVTLEPCAHYGRTPPCTRAIIAARIARVVVAMEDPNPLVAGRGVRELREAGIGVDVGVCAEEAARQNESYIKYITTRRPFVLLKTAISLDGKIATRTGDARWITGETARRMAHRLRDQYDAILVGVGTVIADNPLLTTRLPEGGGKNPVRIIVDSRGRIPLTAKVLTDRSAPTIVAVTPAAPAGVREAIAQAGGEVLVVPAREGRVDLAALMAELGQREIASVLIEGGGEVTAAALAAGIVDKVACFVAPKIIGGRDAPGPVGGAGAATVAGAAVLSKMRVQSVGEDLLIEAYIDRR